MLSILVAKFAKFVQNILKIYSKNLNHLNNLLRTSHHEKYTNELTILKNKTNTI